MELEELRIYAEVLEQGIDFKEYFEQCGFDKKIVNIYSKKERKSIFDNDSITTKIRKCKDMDILITGIFNNTELPLLIVEYSASVPTDDHKMQRSDVYFWGSIFKIPLIKIYASKKGINQSFGGGKKITNNDEIILSFHNGALFYPIEWKNINGSDNILKTKDNALSCIYNDSDICKIIKEIIKSIDNSNSYSEYKQNMFLSYKKQYKDIIFSKTLSDVQHLISNSSRFSFKHGKIVTKINRFGHAMDPDRGIIYFNRMLFGVNNCVTEIQINRKNIKAYCPLFDSLWCQDELNKYVDKIISTKNNIFNDFDALFILSKALNIDSYRLFKKTAKHEYAIDDDVLTDFLNKCPSNTSKCIFYLSTSLILTDLNRNTICKIKWNIKPIQKYLNSFTNSNYSITKLETLNLNNAKEDFVTFSSVELYKKIGCSLVAVSYPGAQGDRCILKGTGRTAKRTYIDIIAVKKNKISATVFLEECKESISKSGNDVKKLKELLNDKEKMKSLENLIYRTHNISNIHNWKISVGAKQNDNIPFLDVDYIFMFDIDDSDADKTIIKYKVAIIDTKLSNMFSSITNADKKIAGSLIFKKFYIIS